MKLGKLLAAGKSIKNGRGTIAYRENKHIYLPKFGSPKNPFIAPAKVESMEPARSSVESSVAPVKKNAAPTWTKTQRMPTISAGPARVTTWVEKFNPIAILRGSASAAKNPLQAIQAELSLEKVKVVHNDLTDVDVEVVPIKSRSAREVPEPTFQPVTSEDAGKNFWSRLDEKFFGANVV